MHGQVQTTERLTPHLIRVVLGGEGLQDFDPLPCTDAYVNIAIPPDGATYGAPFDIDGIKEALPPEQWPIRRRYTVRRWDPVDRLLTLDFVVHGDTGVAGPWALHARPGDLLQMTGPSGEYRPDADADWHLLVGDESALPAIAASLEALPATATAVVRLLCEGAEDELPLSCSATVDLRWLHRRGEPDDADLLPTAVRDLDWRGGRVQAFVHGEAGEVREVRRHLLGDRGMDRADLSASGYWRRHLDDEGWRQIKADWNAAVERDV